MLIPHLDRTPYLGENYPLSLELFFLTRKHLLSQAFSGNLPKKIETNAPKAPPFPRNWGQPCAPYAFEWGGGGRVKIRKEYLNIDLWLGWLFNSTLKELTKLTGESPSPARAQLTVARCVRRDSATGDMLLDAGKMLELHEGQVYPAGAVLGGKFLA